MQQLEAILKELESHFLQSVSQATTEEALKSLYNATLGRNGSFTALKEKLKEMSVEEKRIWAPRFTQLKNLLETTFNQQSALIAEKKARAQDAKKKHFDVTAYLPEQPEGSLHPITSIVERLEDIFISMGFEIADGPEVDTARNNFDALNIPADHPARDMFDTFWLSVPDMLMRTHTSNVQARVMNSKRPPLAIVSLGRCFRHEATDASHDVMFMQIEGLVIDKNISVGNLCATIKTFVQEFFNNKTLELRMRPSYFPFVEPGIEFDITCPFCSSGCSVCKKTGWIELGGSGLVHPNVLEYCGISSKEFSGFAFGFGLTRLAMLTYGINDIRLLSSGKRDFLKQF